MADVSYLLQLAESNPLVVVVIVLVLAIVFFPKGTAFKTNGGNRW